MPLDFDVVACVSGDGLIHEILNGFADHEHPTKALDIPIGPIPTGSGNGLSLNLFGLDVRPLPIARLRTFKRSAHS